MATLGFTDNDGAELGIKYVTKEYVMDWYPDLVPNNKIAPRSPVIISGPKFIP
jgi:hypothetical protein